MKTRAEIIAYSRGYYAGSRRAWAMKPRCKCGKVCVYYGPIGGYSVACRICNAKNAARQRAARRTRSARSDNGPASIP